jgi:uncharacterized protein YhfF
MLESMAENVASQCVLTTFCVFLMSYVEVSKEEGRREGEGEGGVQS